MYPSRQTADGPCRNRDTGTGPDRRKMHPAFPLSLLPDAFFPDCSLQQEEMSNAHESDTRLGKFAILGDGRLVGMGCSLDRRERNHDFLVQEESNDRVADKKLPRTPPFWNKVEIREGKVEANPRNLTWQSCYQAAIKLHLHPLSLHHWSRPRDPDNVFMAVHWLYVGDDMHADIYLSPLGLPYCPLPKLCIQ